MPIAGAPRTCSRLIAVQTISTLLHWTFDKFGWQSRLIDQNQLPAMIINPSECFNFCRHSGGVPELRSRVAPLGL